MMNKIKKIVYFYCIYLFFNCFLIVNWTGDLKNNMLWTLPTNNLNLSWDEKTPLNQIFTFIKDQIFFFLIFISIWVFLYFWFKLITSRWNPEEFKKFQTWFIYAILWLTVIPLALWIVKLVSSLNF